jgi:DNA-directed RNA polymerase specialized sigma24 family protein
MPPFTLLTDDELLSSNDPEAFGVFYDRHVKALLGYFARRTFDAEEAADLTAETFASALADELHTSEAVVRKRMSRGLATLRRRLGR